jgi:hypothetical protein
MYGLMTNRDVEDRVSSSEGEEQLQDSDEDTPVVTYRKVAVSLGVLAIGAVAVIAAVGVYPSVTAPGGSSKAAAPVAAGVRADQQIVTANVEPPSTIADFVKSRRLSAVAAPAFDAKCPMFQSDCNLPEHFNLQLDKELKALHEHDPAFAQALHNTTITAAEQRIILELLPLAHDKNVIDLGQTIAGTVKRWAGKGEQVVHTKVREALEAYSKKLGIAWSAPTNASSSAREGAWKALMDSKMLSLIGVDADGDDQVASRQLFQADPMVVLQSVLGVGSLLRLVLFVFQILHKTKVVILPLWLKATIMWGNLVGGGLACIATILLWCPILFLQYWFNAWLLFSNRPTQLDDWHIAPFGHWMRTHLPGFAGPNATHRLLLAMDPRIAA